MFNSSAFRIADVEIDPKAFARDLSLPDAGEAIRQVDIPGRIDTALGVASEVVRGAVDHLPNRRRRRSRTPFILFGVVLGLLALVGVVGWQTRRAAEARERMLAEGEDPLADAVDPSSYDAPASTHASDATRTTDATTEPADLGVPPRSNGAVHELSAIGDLDRA